MIDNLLEEALADEITEGIALRILEKSRKPKNALRLFQVASMLRDDFLGEEIRWSAGIPAVFPCKVDPRCTYCTFFTDKVFPLEHLLTAVKIIESLGIKQLHLSGGTNLNGYDREIIEMVKAIRTISDIDIEINLGPSFSGKTVKVLKEMNVRSITCSLETINDELFRLAKPGDSLKERKNLLEICEREGVSIRSMIIIGLGETYEDRIRHLFYLKGFNRLYHVRFSRFYPYRNTAYSDHPRCSPWELARTVAVARLIMPNIDLGLAAGNTHDDLPLWYLAGGGRQLLGAGVSNPRRHSKSEPGQQIIPVAENVFVVNNMPLMRQYMEGMGCQRFS